MRNKNLTAAAAMATATALMLAGCATQKPAASSSEAASTAPAESSVVEETTPEEAPSEVTDVDEAAAEDLLLSTETMHYSADDEDGVVTVHKYDENGNEVFMREIDKARVKAELTRNTRSRSKIRPTVIFDMIYASSAKY